MSSKLEGIFFTLFNLLVHTRVNLGWKSAIEGGMENDVDPCCIEQDFVAYDGAHIWRAVLLVDDEGEVCYVHIKGHCKLFSHGKPCLNCPLF